MSETPTLPISDKKTDLIAQNADRILNDPRANAEFFEQARYQLTMEQPPRFEQLDLGTDELPSDTFWEEGTPEASAGAERIEEAKRPVTHAEQLEQDLMYYTDRQLLAYAAANTKAVWALKHLV